MVVITRRLPQSVIAVKKAVNKGAQMNNSLTPAQRFLPPAFEVELNDKSNSITNDYIAEGIANGNYFNNNRNLRLITEKMRKFNSHFIQVLNFAIDREDDDFAPGDRGYYHLPDAFLPNMDSEENAFEWAQTLIAGEASRLAAKPGAVAMSNPNIGKITLLHTTANGYLDQEGTLVTTLNTERAKLNAYLEPGKIFVAKLWNYIETQYLEQPDETRRDMMREWGVVFVSEGAPAIITGLVKSSSGAPKVGATVTLEETGATTTTNAEGRYTLPSTFIGTGDLLIQFPGEVDVTIPVTLTEENEGQNVNMPDVVIG